jgi:hypothetical protein
MRNLKIKSLPNSKEWVDRDIIMLHACFQILCDFMELEKGDEHVNYEFHKDFVDEVRFLYNWWGDRKERDGMEGEDNEMLLRLMKIRECLWT